MMELVLCEVYDPQPGTVAVSVAVRDTTTNLPTLKFTPFLG